MLTTQGAFCRYAFHEELETFQVHGTPTQRLSKDFDGLTIPYFVNEFWTSRQRASHPLHEVSYRACFKAQLPRFFIERLTQPGDTIYDPFMGRGTTPLEAALMGRGVLGCDVNPLSRILCEPRLDPPTMEAVEARLSQIPTKPEDTPRKDLRVFYHPETLREIAALREYLLQRETAGEMDKVDRWIRMVATNRLTGHSNGFFSVYTLPPNQAVSLESQVKINAQRNQVPPRRAVAPLILKKTKSLLRGAESAAVSARLLTGSAEATPEIPDDTVQLVVTSPPFLDVVDYRRDNWLRCWFNGIDPDAVHIWHFPDAESWQAAMTNVLREQRRILRPGGFVAFEVGEVRGGKLLLEDLVVPAGLEAGLEPLAVIINSQEFTKTSNCWGVANQLKGTNTNRIVVFTLPGS